jgi:hypothetical protein
MRVLPGSKLACVDFEQWVPVGYEMNQLFLGHLWAWYALGKKRRLGTNELCY